VILQTVSGNLLVDVGLFITWSFGKPTYNTINSFSDVVSICCEVEIGDLATLIKVWLINEMPW
jgi:hypothetical protein